MDGIERLTLYPPTLARMVTRSSMYRIHTLHPHTLARMVTRSSMLSLARNSCRHWQGRDRINTMLCL